MFTSESFQYVERRSSRERAAKRAPGEPVILRLPLREAATPRFLVGVTLGDLAAASTSIARASWRPCAQSTFGVVSKRTSTRVASGATSSSADGIATPSPVCGERRVNGVGGVCEDATSATVGATGASLKVTAVMTPRLPREPQNNRDRS